MRLINIHTALLAVALLSVQTYVSAAPETITVVSQAAPSDLNTPDLQQYTGFAKSIDRESFAYQFTSMDNVLKQENVAQIKQSGGLGSYSSVSLRGSSGKQVNIFLDGLLLNSAFSGASNIQLLPSVLIENVTVFPDFTPVNLGNANIGGAINFTSRDIKPDDIGGQLQLATGSFGSYQQQLTGFANASGWQLMGAYQQQKAENDYPVDEMIFRSDEAKRQNDQYQSDNGFIKIGKQFNGVNWQLYGQAGNSKKNLATVLNLETDQAFLENQTRRLQTVLDYTAGNWQFSHRLFYATENQLYNDELSSVGLGKNKTETLQEALGVFNADSVFISAHGLITSLDISQNNLYQNSLLAGNIAIIDGKRQLAVLALADHIQATDNWLINISARSYWLDDEIEFVFDKKHYQESTQKRSAALGTQYQWFDFLQLKANLGQSIRIPYLSEQYGSTGLFEGNPELRPESANTIDAGFTLTFEQWKFEAAAFYRDITDGIYTIYDSRGVGHPENIGEATIFGSEAEIHFTPVSWFEIRANGQWLESENLAKVKAFKSKKLPGIYHISQGLGVIFKGERWHFSTDYQYLDQLYYNSANGVEADSQNMLNSSISVFLKPVVLDFTVRNWLDENVLDFNYMPTPGRSLWATVTINF